MATWVDKGWDTLTGKAVTKKVGNAGEVMVKGEEEKTKKKESEKEKIDALFKELGVSEDEYIRSLETGLGDYVSRRDAVENSEWNPENVDNPLLKAWQQKYGVEGAEQLAENDKLRALYGPNYTQNIEGIRKRGAQDMGTAQAMGLTALENAGRGNQSGAGWGGVLAGNMNAQGAAFQRAQGYINDLENQDLDYKKYYADKQMGTSDQYRRLGLGVGQQMASDRFGRYNSNMANDFGAKTSIAGERYNTKAARIGGMVGQSNMATARGDQIAASIRAAEAAREAGENAKWGSIIGAGAVVAGGALGGPLGGLLAKSIADKAVSPTSLTQDSPIPTVPAVPQVNMTLPARSPVSLGLTDSGSSSAYYLDPNYRKSRNT